jgi:hypothetical protein
VVGFDNYCSNASEEEDAVACKTVTKAINCKLRRWLGSEAASVALADGSISVCHWLALASVFEVGQVGIAIDYL